MAKEFSISKKEINRREIAFGSLEMSALIGLIISPLTCSVQIPIALIVVIGISFLLFWFLLLKFFNTSKQLKIRISDIYLERIGPTAHEKYRLADIVKLTVKYTTRKEIREIGLYFQNGKNIFIDGVDNFEQLKAILLEKLKDKIQFSESHEPLDFDHMLFYPILGQIIAFLSIKGMHLLTDLSNQKADLIFTVFSIYVFLLGVYFIYSKPISTRYGSKTASSDLLWGGLMIFSGVLIFFLFSF